MSLLLSNSISSKIHARISLFSFPQTTNQIKGWPEFAAKYRFYNKQFCSVFLMRFLGGLGTAGLSQTTKTFSNSISVTDGSLPIFLLLSSSYQCISFTFIPPFSLFIFSLSFRHPIHLFTTNLLPSLFLSIFLCSFLPSFFIHSPFFLRCSIPLPSFLFLFLFSAFAPFFRTSSKPIISSSSSDFPTQPFSF